MHFRYFLGSLHSLVNRSIATLFELWNGATYTPPSFPRKRESSAFTLYLDPRLRGDDGKHNLFRSTIVTLLGLWNGATYTPPSFPRKRESSAFTLYLDPRLCGDDGKHNLFRSTI